MYSVFRCELCAFLFFLSATGAFLVVYVSIFFVLNCWVEALLCAAEETGIAFLATYGSAQQGADVHQETFRSTNRTETEENTTRRRRSGNNMIKNRLWLAKCSWWHFISEWIKFFCCTDTPQAIRMGRAVDMERSKHEHQPNVRVED